MPLLADTYILPRPLRTTGGGKRHSVMAWFFDTVAECSQWRHYFRANFYAQGRRHAHFRLPQHRHCGDLAFGASTDGDHYGRNGCPSTGRWPIAFAPDAKCRGRSIEPPRLTPQSSSASCFTADAFGFLTFTQCGDRPRR